MTTISGIKTGNVFYSIDSTTGLTIFYGEGSMLETYFISSSPNSNAPWINSRKNMKNIIIENGVTNIGKSAFYYFADSTSYGYSNVKNVKIGKSVNTIGYRAFWSCSSLKTVVIKSNKLTFNEEVFWSCQKLENFYYYGLAEPLYSSRIACWDGVFGCGTDSSRVNCAPFYCAVNSLKTIFVQTIYNGPKNNFCGKSVTISKILQIEEMNSTMNLL